MIVKNLTLFKIFTKLKKFYKNINKLCKKFNKFYQ